jgi:predicted dienelactone hydrolase
MGIPWSNTIYPSVARLFDVFLVFGMLSGQLAVGAEAGRSQATFNVGYRVLDLECRTNGETEVLTVAVWYPTTTKPESHNYGGPTSGNIAVDAPPSAEGGPYPLLVFSHGYGGSGLSAVFLTEGLAARGWIVAAPDHHDQDSAVRIRTGQLKDFNRLGLLRHAGAIAASTPRDRGKYLYRLDEMRCALDGMMTSEPFGKRIDGARVAVGGHSFGGFTALGLCGAIPERHDPRIKGILLFSTGAGGYLFDADELKQVHIPSMLFMGEQEENQRRGAETMKALSAKVFGNLSAPKYFLEIKGATHFAFNNRFSFTRASERMSGTEEQFWLIRRYSIAFLEKYVAGRKDSGHVLEGSDPRLKRYVTEPVADARTRRAEPDAPAEADKPHR